MVHEFAFARHFYFVFYPLVGYLHLNLLLVAMFQIDLLFELFCFDLLLDLPNKFGKRFTEVGLQFEFIVIHIFNQMKKAVSWTPLGHLLGVSWGNQLVLNAVHNEHGALCVGHMLDIRKTLNHSESHEACPA